MAGAAAWDRRGGGARRLHVGQAVSVQGLEQESNPVVTHLQSSQSAFSLLSLIHVPYDARLTPLESLC